MPKPNGKVGNSQTIALAETLGSSVSDAGSLVLICLNTWADRVDTGCLSLYQEEKRGYSNFQKIDLKSG